MKVRQRRKLFAGAGMVSMLAGALMVLAPTGAGAASVTPERNPEGNANPSCADLGYDIEVKHDTTTSAGANVGGQLSTTTTVNGVNYEFVVNWTFTSSAGVAFTVVTDDDAVVDLLVSAAIVKQSSDSSVGNPGGANVYRYNPPVTSDSELVDPANDGQFSHLSFCADIPPAQQTGSLRIVKDVTGAVPQEWSFRFDVSGVGTDPTLSSATGGTSAENTQTLPAGQYTVAELAAGAAELMAIDCGADEVQDPTIAADGESGSASVNVVAGKTTTCRFTNNFPSDQQTGSLRIVKNVTGAVPQEWSFRFDVSGVGTDPTLSSATGGTSAENTQTLPAGQYTVAELAAGAAELMAIDCGADEVQDPTIAADAESGSASVNVVAGKTTTCRFTNNFPGEIIVVPDTYSVTIDKVNDANGDGTFTNSETAGAADDDVEFQVTIGNTGTGALTLQGLTDQFGGRTIDLLDSAVELDCGNTTLGVGSVLPVGSTTVCTFTLEVYAPAAGTSIVNTVTVDTDQADAADTSRVRSPRTEVLPEQQERPPVVTPPGPPAQTPPQAQPEQAQRPAVLGVQTTRQLPRTGSESENLAGLGAGFLLLGVGLVITSRARRYGIAD